MKTLKEGFILWDVAHRAHWKATVVLLISCQLWWFEVLTGDARSKLCWLIPVSWLLTTIRIRLLWIMLMDLYKSLHYKQHHHPPHQHHHLEQWLTHHVTSIRCINHRNKSLENNPGNISSQHLVTTEAVTLIQSEDQSSYLWPLLDNLQSENYIIWKRWA